MRRHRVLAVVVISMLLAGLLLFVVTLTSLAQPVSAFGVTPTASHTPTPSPTPTPSSTPTPSLTPTPAFGYVSSDPYVCELDATQSSYVCNLIIPDQNYAIYGTVWTVTGYDSVIPNYPPLYGGSSRYPVEGATHCTAHPDVCAAVGLGDVYTPAGLDPAALSPFTPLIPAHAGDLTLPWQAWFNPGGPFLFHIEVRLILGDTSLTTTPIPSFTPVPLCEETGTVVPPDCVIPTPGPSIAEAPTETPTATPTAMPTETPTETPTEMPSTPTWTPTATFTPSPSATPTPGPYDECEIKLLIVAVAYELGDGGPDMAEATAHIALNRMKDPRWQTPTVEDLVIREQLSAGILNNFSGSCQLDTNFGTAVYDYYTTDPRFTHLAQDIAEVEWTVRDAWTQNPTSDPTNNSFWFLVSRDQEVTEGEISRAEPFVDMAQYPDGCAAWWMSFFYPADVQPEISPYLAENIGDETSGMVLGYSNFVSLLTIDPAADWAGCDWYCDGRPDDATACSLNEPG